MKLEAKKFGNILSSRPAGREAALVIKAYFKPDSKENIELDFSDVISVGPAWLDEALGFLRKEYGEKRVICLPTDNASVNQSLAIIDS